MGLDEPLQSLFPQAVIDRIKNNLSCAQKKSNLQKNVFKLWLNCRVSQTEGLVFLSPTEWSQIEPQVRHDQTWTNASLSCVSLHCFLVTGVPTISCSTFFCKGGSQMTGRGHARFVKESLKCFWKACSNDRGVKNLRSASSNKRVKVQKKVFKDEALRGVKRGGKKAKHYRLWFQSTVPTLLSGKMFQLNPLNMSFNRGVHYNI